MLIKIYQINTERDEMRVKFQQYDSLNKIQGDKKVNKNIYDIVFEGEVNCTSLEDVYEMFNLNHPVGFRGHSLSVSDVVEIVHETKKVTHHFCDTFGFKEIKF